MRTTTHRIVEDEISLKDLILKIRGWWRFLLSKWIIIVSAGIVGSIIGFTYAYYKKPVYTATTTFVLETGDGNSLGQYAGLASMVGIDIGGGGGGIFQGDNIIELYKSRTMLEKALLSPVSSASDSLLIDRFLEFNEIRENWKDQPALAELRFQSSENKKGDRLEKSKRLKDSIIGDICDIINDDYLAVSKPDKKLSILHVDVKAKDEVFAKRFNEELVRNVNEFYVQTKTKKSVDNIAILQHKTDSVRAVMGGAIYSAVSVTDATPNLNPTRQVQRVVPLQKAQFSAETNKTILMELVKNLEMSKMALMKETPLIQTVDAPIYPLAKEKLGKAKGIILGGIVAGILACALLLIRKLYSNIIN